MHVSDKPVLFNGISLCGGGQVGVHRFATELIKRVGTYLPEGQEVRLAVPAGWHCTELEPYVTEVSVGEARDTRSSRMHWESSVLPAYVDKTDAIGLDLTIGLPPKAFSFVAIHDCIREEFPEEAKGAAGKLKRQLYIERVKRVVRNKGTRIITVSQYSRSQIARRYHVDEDRIDIIYNGWEHVRAVNPDPAVLTRLGLAEKGYYFSLGTRLPHKNIAWVLEAAKLNPQETFVITGNGYGAAGEGGPSNVLFSGYLSDAEINALMRGAKALIQPSLSEGFGIPPLEAIALGTPAIVANASCLPEIYGPYVSYLDPHDPHYDFAEAAKAPLPDPMPLLEKYSWESSAKKLVSLIAAS